MERRALVIGNKDYKNLGPLNNPVNDARLIGELLTSKGFEVHFFKNLGFENFLEEINKFGELIHGGEGIVFFYYAGHSIQLMDSNYLLPVDIDRDLSRHKNVENGAIYLGDVTQALNKFKGEKVVVLDACRKHDFNDEIIATSEIFNKGLSEIESSHGMAIIYSTQPGNTASDGISGSINGCFTEELAKNIRLYGLSLNDIVVRTREGVLSKTNYKQIPWSSNSIHRDVNLDHIRFPGSLEFEFELPSNGVDTISGSNSNVFMATQQKQIFVLNNVSKISPIKDDAGQVASYLFHRPCILSLDLEKEDCINEAYFLDDDIMFAVSEDGYLFLYDIQRMLAGNLLYDSLSLYPETDYRPSILFEKSDHDHFFCVDGFGDYVFFAGSSGTLYRINIFNIKRASLSRPVDEFRFSEYHITSIACNPATGSICVTDERYVYFLDESIDVVNSVSVRSSNVLFSEELGFVVASNNYKILFFDDVGQEIKGSVNLSVKQHPLLEKPKEELFITSLDIVDDRYVIVGTNKPSLLMYDTLLDSIVNEKFLDIHMTSPFGSAVYDMHVCKNGFLYSRSKMHHIGMWRLEKI